MKKLKEGHWPIFLLSSLSSVANLFLPIILVRILTPDAIGTYKTFFVYFSILPFIALSGGPLHSVYYWVGHSTDRKEDLLNATWTLTLLLSCLVLLAGLPLEAFLEHHLHQSPGFIYLLVICSFLSTPSSHFSEASIALGKRAFGSIFETGFEIVKVAGFIAIAYLTRDIGHLFIFYAVLLTIKTLATALLNSRFNGIHSEFNREAIKQVFSYSAPIAVTGCLGIFVDKIDLLILTTKLDPTSFAFYSMGCLVIPPLYLLETSVQKVLIPQMSKAYQNQKWDDALLAYRRAIADIGHLVIPAIFGLILFAGPIVELLFTKEFVSSTPYLRLFALSYLLLLFPHDSAARATGNSSWILKTYFIATPISLIVTYVAADYLPATHVLLITIGLKFLPKLLGLWFTTHIMHWKFSSLLPYRILGFQIALAGILSALCLLLHNSFSTEMWWFITLSPIFAIIYLSAHSWFMKRYTP